MRINIYIYISLSLSLSLSITRGTYGAYRDRKGPQEYGSHTSGPQLESWSPRLRSSEKRFNANDRSRDVRKTLGLGFRDFGFRKYRSFVQVRAFGPLFVILAAASCPRTEAYRGTSEQNPKPDLK